MFTEALNDLLIKESLFCSKIFIPVDRDKQHNISREPSTKIIESCDEFEWKLIFALCRCAGLRCPSEVLALAWQDIQWDAGRFLIRAAKTDYVRMAPLFPRLRELLDEARDLASENSTNVIRRYRDTEANLRTQLDPVIRRAETEP